ncbi:PAS domain S-box-containing protein [Pseudomonas duriflava]|uniref:histidine kinase n=1 Tax=Pseudomonas duriflava TaxID=459528 RepID=A0A562QFR7_9PSED|nr:histidine kinase famiy protein [Pseudomonas duriflava]TWI55581.1 PAS domain S-box-containing protein [Pseudomonas duriflava]
MTSDNPKKPVGDGRYHVTEGMPDEVHSQHSDLFFAAVKMTRIPMLVTDPRQPDNPIIFANEAFLRATGYEESEVLGRNCRFLQGPDTDLDMVKVVRDSIDARKECSVEILNYRKDGSTFWNALYISPVFNRAGELVYFFSSQLDVSRRHDAEEALSQAQKMEALGQLTGGIAHDFNNLLQVMVGYLDILRINLDRTDMDREKAKRHVDSTRDAVNRAATLTQQLLAFARKQRLTGRTLNLNELIAGRVELLAHTLGEAYPLTTRLSSELWNCKIDPTQAEMAMINILANARDAMESRQQGHVTLETRNVEITPQDMSYGSLAPGRYVCVSITDTGEGIPPEILGRVLDPFFTTKEEGKGTGLGLSMVYGFMKQSGGAVRLYSEVGMGTTVRLYFPAAAQDDAGQNTTAASAPSDEPGHETILVVDDREEVAALAQAILEEFGYSVRVAYNGREALAALEAQPQIHMLFSDLIMPGGMNGVMLAQEARRRWPHVKVLLTTGYADTTFERNETDTSEFEVLSKPYGRLELARRVRRILDEAG